MSLSKFGIFTGPNEVERPFKHPRQKYRYRVDFINFAGVYGGKNVTFETNTVDLPTATIETQTLHGYNSQSKYAGKLSWNDISISVRDTFDNSVIKEVAKQMEVQFDPYEQVTATVATNYKFTTNINFLGGHGETTGRWELGGCFLPSINYGALDYGSSERNDITLTLSYDNATLYDETDALVTDGSNVSTLLNYVSVTGGFTGG